MYCVTIHCYRRAALFYHTGYHKAIYKALEEKVKLYISHICLPLYFIYIHFVIVSLLKFFLGGL